MKVEQISIFLENKPGGLEFVTRVLKDAGINIRALSLADTSDFGVLRLIVNDAQRNADRQVQQVENFIAQAQISQNNLFGRGQTLALQAHAPRSDRS